MAHWSDKYVGEPYVPETHDCAAFVARAVAAEFGIARQLPAGHGTTPAEYTALISKHLNDYLVPTDTPADGDVMLCRVGGRDYHLGLLCVIHGERWMIHASDKPKVMAVIRSRLSDFRLLGMKIEGFYKCK